jgi:hypothetical protein
VAEQPKSLHQSWDQIWRQTQATHLPVFSSFPKLASMDPPGQGFDLNQVAKLFNDIIAVTRDETPDIAALEPQAVAWLKDARNKLMRDIEAAYVYPGNLFWILIFCSQLPRTLAIAQDTVVAASLGSEPR